MSNGLPRKAGNQIPAAAVVFGVSAATMWADERPEEESGNQTQRGSVRGLRS